MTARQWIVTPLQAERYVVLIVGVPLLSLLISGNWHSWEAEVAPA